jgi:hypothetical protein
VSDEKEFDPPVRCSAIHPHYDVRCQRYGGDCPAGHLAAIGREPETRFVEWSVPSTDEAIIDGDHKFVPHCQDCGKVMNVAQYGYPADVTMHLLAVCICWPCKGVSTVWADQLPPPEEYNEGSGESA